ncbi:SDR family NAD(P)-dependent oxidoreductase [Zestomonas carbonaria]|uniref:3-oxoacyl-[acyl-carrier-protein] reductase n=1 Tax=Zestomonas carbonaria TaxID=2762745 RepID=A0A7U7IAY3_9GAMM|nr:SDR family oxidoreductase [Pseudomonas carbonaria]CAD5109371.1 3-oxoacyl-[acyl-carrier-protein] reductase [Pseudomonas carbonaria]
MGKLDNKVALITGSGRGIGREVALKLASEGASVVINDLDATPAEETVADIIARGGKAVACIGSVTAPDFAERFVKTAIDHFGGVDIIVNNAGYTWDNVVQKMTDEQWYAMLDVHMTAPFRIFRAAAGFIRESSKREAEAGVENFRKIVNISSVAGLGGNPGQVGYSSAKAGIVGMTKTLAKEWGRYKVNVNCVAFGFITTRLTEATADADASVDIEGRKIKVGISPDLAKMMERSIPLGRAGRPEEAAGAVAMFCYPESDYVSGEVLICGGGISL